MEHQGPWQQIPFPGVSVSWTLSPPPFLPLLSLGKGWQSSSSSSGYIRVVLRPSTVLAPYRLSTLKVRVIWRDDLVFNVLAGRATRFDTLLKPAELVSKLISKRTRTRFVNGFIFFCSILRTMQPCPTLLDSPMKKRNNDLSAYFSKLPYGLSYMKSALDYLLADKGKLTLQKIIAKKEEGKNRRFSRARNKRQTTLSRMKY